MTIQEELTQKKTNLRAKISEARQAVADKVDNADNLMQEVSGCQKHKNKCFSAVTAIIALKIVTLSSLLLVSPLSFLN